MTQEPLYTVHWTKKWDGPILPAAQCRHEGMDALTINQRLEPNARGKGYHIELDGSLCMRCGTDSTGQLSLVEGLSRCMDQHGWNRETGLRLYGLVEFHKDALQQETRVPIWFAHAWDWDWQTIKAGLLALESEAR